MPKQTTRRRFLKTGLAAGTGALIAPSHTIGNQHSKKLLFVWGGWEGHQPKECMELLVPWIKDSGFDVRVSDSLDAYLDRDYMAEVDIIVQIWTMGTITEEQEKSLLETVRAGAGLAGWHGGLGDAFRQNTKYQFMVGGQWVAHPGGIIDYTVKVSDPTDPVTQGITEFAVHSEQYYMHVDPNNKVLATTTFSGAHADWIAGCTMPVVWKKIYGKGRVFYCSIGHQMHDFLNSPDAFTMLKRGILWASDSKYQTTENLIRKKY